ncbi:MAG TPA: hypothetical protein VK853_10665 [Ilumatobacteraceae bacterium]|nr:hypothetical protein [Ilumatobacteraceae bacterium]
MGLTVSTSPRSFVGLAVAVVTAVALMAGCATDIDDPVTFEEYVAELEAICGATTERLLALPSAPEQIAVADLATSAAEILDDEASRVDRLVVPDADGLDDPAGNGADLAGDHRAFVRNTREQAAAWRTVAAGGDDLAADTEVIAQLVGGRNELARSMGVEGCVRGGL